MQHGLKTGKDLYRKARVHRTGSNADSNPPLCGGIMRDDASVEKMMNVRKGKRSRKGQKCTRQVNRAQEATEMDLQELSRVAKDRIAWTDVVKGTTRNVL